MNIQEIVNAIGSVGFPIVACCGLFYLYDRTIKEIINALDNVKETLHKVDDTLGDLSKKLDE
jgi:hypothetical protein